VGYTSGLANHLNCKASICFPEVVSRLNENDGFCSYGCDRKFRVCWYSVRNAEDAGRYVPPGAEQTDRHLRQQRRTQRTIAKGPRNDGPDSAELIKPHRDSLKRLSDVPQ